jgi:RHS repeat-associated protein
VLGGGNTQIWKWDSEPFGSTAANQDPDGNAVTFTLNLRFPGQYFDSQTGTHYNYFRDYNPKTGRYLQSDPIGLAGGINTYGYVGASPLLWIDPLGLDVSVCSQPAFGWMSVDHQWIKTDTVEAGMGGTRGNEAGNQTGDLPGDPVQVTDHSGRSKQEGATCKKVEGHIDEATVNEELALGRKLGRWGPTNHCQSFVKEVISRGQRTSRGVIRR